MVECQLPKLDVAGSTPVARSKILLLNSLLPKAIFLGFGTKVEKCPKRAQAESGCGFVTKIDRPILVLRVTVQKLEKSRTIRGQRSEKC